MKHSLLLAVLVASLGLTACGKSSTQAAPVYTGAQKVAYDAAVDKCKSEPFDSRDKCVSKAMGPASASASKK